MSLIFLFLIPLSDFDATVTFVNPTVGVGDSDVGDIVMLVTL